MSDAEYARMDALEATHWWYLGLRDLVGRVLMQHAARVERELSVLDAGCGTGENLRLCAERLPGARLAGFDVSQRALEYARRKVPRAELQVGDVTAAPPIPLGREYDVILSLDVLQITGLAPAAEGMRVLTSQLRPGGLLILNLPAYQWLYSRHDVAVSTRYRFTRAQVREFLTELGLEPVRLSYRLWPVFPAFVAMRWATRSVRPSDGPIQSDLSPVHPRVNSLLYGLLRQENAWLARGGSLPWGSSVFAVGEAERREAASG
ncbi:MAG: class I SAM-dependent methyltransferase [Pirellulaceae bacterium]